MSADRRRGCGSGSTPGGEDGGEGGAVTVWLLGLAVAVLFLGGLSVDLWRVAAERRELAGVVDGAAVAGASVIDEAAFRSSGRVRLDVQGAADAACTYLRVHADPPAGCGGVEATPAAVRVEAERHVPLTLLRALAPGLEPIRLRVSATVEPRSSP